MPISVHEWKMADLLTLQVSKHHTYLPYVNYKDSTHMGWVYDLHIRDWKDQPIRLNLHREKDLFLLFAFALGRALNGPWENAVYLVAYLKLSEKHSPEYWLSIDNVLEEIQSRDWHADLATMAVSSKTIPRHPVRFNEEIFHQLHILAKNWQAILSVLNESRETKNYRPFLSYMSIVPGISTNITIASVMVPQILKELRHQGIHPDIPGQMCCVLDRRVLIAARGMGIHLIPVIGIKSYLEVAEKVHKLFPHQFDLPLFAYKDLNTYCKIKNKHLRHRLE